MKRPIAIAAALAVVLIACVNAAAADKQYAFGLDYSAIPADILKRQITISVSVGTAASCNVTADRDKYTDKYSGSGNPDIYLHINANFSG